jgi:putative hydrolase of the HAD superfamily
VRKRALMLDAMGTLVRLEPPAPRLREELRRLHGILIEEEEARRAIAAEIAYYRAHHDEGSDAEGLARLRANCADVLRDALPEAARGRLGTVAGIPGGLTDTLMASLRFSVYDDVRPALVTARRSGYRIVVVSNWDISLHEVLERLDLAPHLDGVLTSAEAGARKPDPAILVRALAIAGVPAQHAMHVGDSLEEDVEAARAAGIEPVLVHRHEAPRPAGVRVVRTLAELID